MIINPSAHTLYVSTEDGTNRQTVEWGRKVQIGHGR